MCGRTRVAGDASEARNFAPSLPEVSSIRRRGDTPSSQAAQENRRGADTIGQAAQAAAALGEQAARASGNAARMAAGASEHAARAGADLFESTAGYRDGPIEIDGDLRPNAGVDKSATITASFRMRNSQREHTCPWQLTGLAEGGPRCTRRPPAGPGCFLLRPFRTHP
jgi:hypothetical protein